MEGAEVVEVGGVQREQRQLVAQAAGGDPGMVVRPGPPAQLGLPGQFAPEPGPLEKSAADDLMSQVSVIADNPSARAAALRVTKKIGANDIKIFGTADRLGVPIFTSDLRALRGAAAQGVDFDAIVHPPFSFNGY